MRCAKCGKENPDGAEECVRCGEGLGSADAPHADQAQAPMPLITRAALALITGLLVFAISCDVAYHEYLGSAVRRAQEITLRDIGTVGHAVEAYRQKNHALPSALTDFPQVSMRVDRNGAPADGWDRPLHYWKNGSRFRITSYGRDGKPGGVGLDADLSSDDLKGQQASPAGGRRPKLPQRARPTFSQFVTDRGETVSAGSGRMMFLTCILAGAVAVLLGFWATRGAAAVHRTNRARVGRLLITAAATLLVAVIYIIPLHMPSGH